eukprot:scaffold13716_cov122-Isochrysis_galbana.AAC.8
MRASAVVGQVAERAQQAAQPLPQPLSQQPRRTLVGSFHPALLTHTTQPVAHAGRRDAVRPRLLRHRRLGRAGSREAARAQSLFLLRHVHSGHLEDVEPLGECTGPLGAVGISRPVGPGGLVRRGGSNRVAVGQSRGALDARALGRVRTGARRARGPLWLAGALRRQGTLPAGVRPDRNRRQRSQGVKRGQAAEWGHSGGWQGG